MSFLNPLILIGLAAASFPLLIHLFTRTKSRTIQFSTVEFLKRLQNDQVRRIKLRQILLLILRTLIIILLVLVFARPTLENSLSAASPSNAKSSMAIIVDNSLSMLRPSDGRSLYTEMVQRAKSVADLLNPGDEAFLITTTDTALAVSRRSFHDPDLLKNELDGLAISYSATNIDAALRLASNLLARSSNVNKEIYLLSDMQTSAITQDSLSISKDSRFYIWPSVVADVSNLSIIDARLSSTILQRGKLAEAIVSVRNTGNVDVENAVVQLFDDGRRVAQTTLHLAADETVSKEFRFILEKSGFSEASVQLEDDDVLEDNVGVFSFYVPEQLTVGLVGEEADLFHVALAVAADESDENFSLQRISQARLRTTAMSDFDVFIISDISGQDQQTLAKLKEFVENGGGLFIALGDNVDMRVFNTTIAAIFQLPHIVDIIGSTDGREGALSLEKFDAGHPLFSGVFQTNEADFTKPEFRFAVKAALNEKANSIMQYSNGDPFLYERKMGQGTIIVMTSGFNERLTDLSRRTIFAPLMTRIIAYGGSVNSTNEISFFIGDEIRYKLPPTTVNLSLEIKRPDDKYDRLKPVITPNGAWIHYSLTNLPGAYELLVDGAVQSKWAVQIPHTELDMTALETGDLKKMNSAIVLQDNMMLSESIASQRHGRELWFYFALAALILLIVEMLLYREKGEVAVD